MKRLLIVNHYAVTSDMAGGTRHTELANHLTASGWSTRIYSSAFLHGRSAFLKGVSLLHPWQTSHDGSATFTWLYSSPYKGNGVPRYINMLTFGLSTCIAITLSKFRPDVIYGSSPHLLAAAGALLGSRIRRVPFVLEVRDLWPETLMVMGVTNPAVITPLGWIERHLYEKASAIVCLTEGIRQNIASRVENPDRVVMIPNAAHLSESITEVERNTLRASRGWSPENFVAVYAGAHGPANDLGQILAAARHVRSHEHLKFVLVGDGPEKEALKRSAVDLPNVQFLDSVAKSDIHTLLQSADAGLLTLQDNPVFRGARPNKLFDYLGNGLPIATTVDGEVRSIIESIDAGEFAAGPAELAERLVSWCDNPAEARAKGIRGRDYARVHLSREATARSLDQVLSRVIEETST